jgi:uncharacterized Tic20 family protein
MSESKSSEEPQAPPAPPPPPPASALVPPPAGYAPAPQQAHAPVPLRPDEERNAAMLSHLISLLAILLSASWIVALIYYLIYKDRGAYGRSHTATELNFQLTMIGALIAGTILTFVFIGILVIFAVPVLMIVFGIIATLKASRGELYTYPIAIRFVR